MVKKCIICQEEAVYKIKDNPDYYCQECAEENFADLSLLVRLEEEAQRLKYFLKEKMDDLLNKEEELDKRVIIKDKIQDKTQDKLQDKLQDNQLTNNNNNNNQNKNNSESNECSENNKYKEDNEDNEDENELQDY